MATKKIAKEKIEEVLSSSIATDNFFLSVKCKI